MEIRIADIKIAIDNRYDTIEQIAKDYIVQDDQPYDIYVSVSEAEIDYFESITEEKCSRGSHEVTAILDVLCQHLLEYDAYLFHSAVVEVDGKAFAFSARTGTGKSTHVKQWLKYFGDRARVVNGDKPFLFLKEGQLFAAGTPWSGKEGWQTNVLVPLAGICFLERGEENKIRPAKEGEILDRLFPQIRIPKDPNHLNHLMGLLDWTIKNIPFYVLEATISPKAAKVAYEGMNPQE